MPDQITGNINLRNVGNNFNISLELGQQYQDFMVTFLLENEIAIPVYSSKAWQMNIGESASGWEFKHDILLKTKHNLFVETMYKGEYSGIYKNDNTVYWVQGDYDKSYRFKKIELKDYCENNCRHIGPTQFRTCGYILPEKEAYAICLEFYELPGEPEWQKKWNKKNLR